MAQPVSAAGRAKSINQPVALTGTLECVMIISIDQFLEQEGIGSGTNITISMVKFLIRKYGKAVAMEQKNIVANVLQPKLSGVRTGKEKEKFERILSLPEPQL